jgi:hypothetical protein
MLNTISGMLSGGVPDTDYQSIQTFTLGSAQSSITFSSIPSTYTHLQIRGITKSTSGLVSTFANFNGDSGSNYSRHQLLGDGASASAAGDSSVTTFYTNIFTNTANNYGATVIDILDYANTNKYKTVRTFAGYDANGSGYVLLRSALWQSTSAITTIALSPSAGNFDQYSSFALYGIK